MNINELNSFDLSAAVKFHDRLNPKIWGRDEHLLPEVQSQLLRIAADFQEFLGVADLALKDITISGSNAAYSYTPDSDIDLHLVVDMPADNSEVYQELFNAKKYQYNDEHDIRIGGADVELYVQPADQPHVSQGIYSVQDKKWLQVPRRIKADLDDHCVQHKVEDLEARIDMAIESGDKSVMQRIWDKIKTMRQTGLAQSGEFGCDNLVFKMLRRSGHLERLKKAKTAAHDRELSLQERKRKKQRVRYGFGGWWYPGFGYAGDSSEGGGDGGGGESVREGHYGSSLSSEDGVAPSTAMFVTEDDRESVIQQFIKHTAQRLGIENLPQIELHNDDEWSKSTHSFGRYEPEAHVLHVNLQGRHIMDILRTTAHELAHCRQHEIKGIEVNDGATGSPVENEAHAVAGIIMRDWADRHPELFADLELTENASGYIPKNKKEAAMPQYAMALSVDIQPGEVGRQANKLALKTGRNGEPQLLMKTANLREGRIRDLNEPLGPETPPTMPAGTVRVDVSDVYDWYKLGQHISNMKGLGRHDFGAGPPSSIISFGDEETEHKFIKDLAATGLDVTDIDPRDPKQPPGMRRIKTDPTYNVSEAGRIQYKEIEFVCANPQFPDATDPELQQQMYVGLTKIPGVIPLWQDQSDYSAGQASLTAIYKDRASRQQIMKLAKQLGVKIDLEQPVSDSYVDRAIRGEHEGQRGITEADAARTAKSAIDQTEVFGVRGYRARCLEPGCEWHSRSYDRIKQAQDSAKKHAAAHIKQGVAEGKIRLSTDPNWYGAEVGDYKASGPVVNISATQLVGFEPDDKMNQPKSKANVEKIVAGLKQGAKLPPLLVRQYKNGYQVLDGHHRFWAYKLLGVKSIPAQVVPEEDIEEITKQGVAEDLDAEAYKQKLLSSLPGMMKFFAKNVQGWRPSREQMLAAIETGYTVMKHTGDVKQAGRAVMDELNTLHRMSQGEQGVTEGYSDTTFNVDRRKLNVPALIQNGAILVTYPHSDQGWETDNKEDWAFSLLSLYNVLQGGWPSEAKKYLKPQSYKRAEQQINSSAPNLGSDKLVYDGKYNQILWSIKKLGIPENVAFLDKDDQNKVDEDELVESLRREFALLEDEFIGEIKMSPSNLRAEAAKTGALAGMEFEMIVPGVKQEDPEPEPDYDQDERCRSIDDAVEFFHDGDYNGRREVERLRERMQEDFGQWLYEKIDEDWANNPEEYIYQYLVRDVDASTIGEIIGQDLSDADGPTKQQVTQAAEIVNDNEQQPYYDDARDWHREEYQDAWDESDWLDDADLDVMSAIENAYEISWPHWNYGDGESEADIETVADDFRKAVGMPVNTSTQYHGGRREAGHYVIEPDGSLRPESDDDTGLEFVSPPMPIDEMLDQLKKVRQWAGRYGCYTNDSTGLHINVSVPEFSNDKLDYVKLALLLGDQYVLDQFGRSSNTYTKSALSIVQDRVRGAPGTAKAMLDKMRGHLDDLATKAIHSGDTSKYTSINTKEGYIEFRSPGGDWLDENFDKVENTLLRFTVALKAAMDPEAYREEYLKKLYKLLEPTAQGGKGSDTVRYFADYVAGKIPAAALRSFVKQAQLQRKIAKEPAAGKQYWWRVWKDGQDARNTAMIEVVASSEREAIDKAAAEFGVTSSAVKAYMDAVAIRPYVETQPASQPAGQMRPSNPDGNYVIFANNSRAGDPPAYRFMAADGDDAETVLNQWRRENPGDWEVHYDAYQRLGQPPVPGSTLDRQRQRAAQSAGSFEFERSQTDIENRLGWPDQTGDANYEVVNRNTLQPVYLFIANTDQDAARKYREIIDAMGMPGAAENYGYRARGSVMPPVDRQGTQSGSQRPAEGGNFTGNWLILDPQGREIHRFSGVGNVQSDANRVAIQWMRSRPGTMQAGVTVVPEMQ